MPATKFICPDGQRIDIAECLRGCPNNQRCMFLPTLRAVANSLDRNFSEPTVTKLIAGTRETFLKKTTDYAVEPASVLYALHSLYEVFNMNTLKELTRNNIWTALEDYFRHTESNEVYDNISDNFVERLASDSIKSKRELRELFCKSQGWDENLQAIVINGTKTHNPNYILVHNLANSILRPAKWDADCDKLSLIDRAICFFSRPNDKDESYINAIETLAPQASAPRKKRSRIFKAICDSLGVTDLSAGSEFQPLFAQFADELSTKKIDFKLFMSINPAHFLTNTHGGTCGVQAESKLYRDLVQRELSELEGVPNLWKTEKYCGNKHGIHIACGNGFGGYPD